MAKTEKVKLIKLRCSKCNFETETAVVGATLWCSCRRKMQPVKKGDAKE